SVDNLTPDHSAFETSPWIACAVTCSGSLENIGAELPAHSTNDMRVTSGYRASVSSVNSSGWGTMPWVTSLCLAGWMSGTPAGLIEKWIWLGVTGPFRG